MAWLDNVHVGGNQTFSSVVDRLTPVMTRGAAMAGGARKADLLAHTAYGASLEARDGRAVGDVAQQYREAIADDAARNLRLPPRSIAPGTVAVDNISTVATLDVMRSADPSPDELLPLPPATFHILMALADEDRHGYAMIQEVAARTGGRLKLSAGTLYRSIQRMLEQGLIVEPRERPPAKDDDERRRYYRLTAFGRRVAEAEMRRLSDLVRIARNAGLHAGKA